MTETINDRIKLLRKKKDMNQGEFGKAIGLKQGAISKLEKPGNAVVDQNIQLICEKFQVRREWLVDGTGEMFAERAKKDELMEWAERVSQSPHDSFPYRLAEVLAKLDEPQGKMLEQIFDKIMAEGGDGPPARTNDTVCALARSIDAPADTAADTGNKSTGEAARLHAQLDAELQAERRAASASSVTSSEKRA